MRSSAVAEPSPKRSRAAATPQEAAPLPSRLHPHDFTRTPRSQAQCAGEGLTLTPQPQPSTAGAVPMLTPLRARRHTQGQGVMRQGQPSAHTQGPPLTRTGPPSHAGVRLSYAGSAPHSLDQGLTVFAEQKVRPPGCSPHSQRRKWVRPQSAALTWQGQPSTCPALTRSAESWSPLKGRGSAARRRPRQGSRRLPTSRATRHAAPGSGCSAPMRPTPPSRRACPSTCPTRTAERGRSRRRPAPRSSVRPARAAARSSRGARRRRGSSRRPSAAAAARRPNLPTSRRPRPRRRTRRVRRVRCRDQAAPCSGRRRPGWIADGRRAQRCAPCGRARPCAPVGGSHPARGRRRGPPPAPPAS
mmetsp:Transcript_66150/g.181339  ORF Transcript_66150/g.181339 Transcript_66150/m.181339 type:complete len:358 (-) Transcript_66150:445-1518(-)